MKPFDFKYGRKKEIDDEKKGNVILMVESEDEDSGFQQEMEATSMEEIIYTESSIVDFSTNMFLLIDNIGGARMKSDYSYVCGIQEVDGGEYDLTGLRTTNLAKSKFVSVAKDQFAISESQLKDILPDLIFEMDCRKELFGFQVLLM
ncbi:hypothetical protein AVEN_54631-1 [Araneus ventricosus]|uniref:Uncharacterized protein n=1 Tax=Araneus ventricosus TaxID=182803 RepID=A0A4Y2BM13_ARAVE|nr:hypothetical protein AVEN_54631-1 [Araneus ventricosus]